MSKKKKIIIGCVAGGVVVAAAAVAIFVFDIFGGKPYNYDLSEYVKVGNYKGLEYGKVEVSVNDDEIQAEIKSRLEKASKTTDSTTGTVADGDTINISYEGKIDGKTFEGGSSDSYDLTIGKTSMIPGFTDGLIGANIGDKVTLNLKFPDDYSEKSVAGKPVVFTVTVNSKSVTTTPEYNVDFIKANSDYDNAADYEASVKKDLIKSKTEKAKTDIKNGLWTKILDSSEVKKYPDKEIKEVQKQFKEQYKAYADQYGVKWEEFLKSYMNMTEEDFEKQSKTYSESVVKSKMVMYSIARKENITVNDSDFDKYLLKLIKDSGFTEASFKKAYGKTIQQYAKDNDMKSSYMLEKVLDKVMKDGTEK